MNINWHVQCRMRLGSFEVNVDFNGDNTPVVLIGPNGSGKTTLLRAIAGAYRPASGHISVGNQVLFDYKRRINLPLEERQVGYLPQGYGLFPNLNVIDNIAFGWLARKPRIAKNIRRRSALEILEKMECTYLATRYPSTLSGGEKQRVALARALMIDPQMLLLDEPMSGLDVLMRRLLRAYLAKHLADRARPAIVVMHDVRDVLAINARVYVMENGKFVQNGFVETLAERPATEFVAEFFNLGKSLREAQSV